MTALFEHTAYDDAKIELVESKNAETGSKNLFMKGIFIQAETLNQNKRVYPLREIQNAVNTINEKIAKNGPVPGEAEHPDTLTINIERI